MNYNDHRATMNTILSFTEHGLGSMSNSEFADYYYYLSNGVIPTSSSETRKFMRYFNFSQANLNSLVINSMGLVGEEYQSRGWDSSDVAYYLTSIEDSDGDEIEPVRGMVRDLIREVNNVSLTPSPNRNRRSRSRSSSPASSRRSSSPASSPASSRRSYSP